VLWRVLSAAAAAFLAPSRKTSPPGSVEPVYRGISGNGSLAGGRLVVRAVLIMGAKAFRVGFAPTDFARTALGELAHSNRNVCEPVVSCCSPAVGASRALFAVVFITGASLEFFRTRFADPSRSSAVLSPVVGFGFGVRRQTDRQTPFRRSQYSNSSVTSSRSTPQPPPSWTLRSIEK